MLMTRYSIKTKILAFFNKIGIRIYASPKRTGASPRGGLVGAVPSGFGGACFVGAFILLSLFSCSSDDDGGGRTSKVERQTVRLYLNIPSSDGTRVGDPGQSAGEGIAWDKLAVMIEYPDVSGNENIPGADRHRVIYVDKTDYDAGIDAQGYYWVPLDLPEGKVRRIEELRRQGRCVAFVGDGINDAPVLALSDVGVAMGALGSDMAVETADVVIQTDQPSKVAAAVRIARRTRRIVRQNIVFAIGVKVLVMLLGLAGMANLWAAVFADVGVALLAVMNATRVFFNKK